LKAGHEKALDLNFFHFGRTPHEVDAPIQRCPS